MSVDYYHNGLPPIWGNRMGQGNFFSILPRISHWIPSIHSFVNWKYTTINLSFFLFGNALFQTKQHSMNYLYS